MQVIRQWTAHEITLTADRGYADPFLTGLVPKARCLEARPGERRRGKPG